MKNTFQLIALILLSVFSQSCHRTQNIQNNHSSESGSQKEDGLTFFLTPKGDTIHKVIKSDEAWKTELSEQEYNVLRKKGTERAFTGDLHDLKTEGIYVCRGCQFPLFDSKTKFDSGTGWPSYYQPFNSYCIDEQSDNTLGMNRVEVLCRRCGGHLGHVFDDGPKPTGLRYCINSASLDFMPLPQKSKN